jgi:MoxR-like ATPase
MALFRSAQAVAAVRGNEFVLPDDVKRMAPAVLAHRLIVRPESRLRKVTATAVVQQILTETPVPSLSRNGT